MRPRRSCCVGLGALVAVGLMPPALAHSGGSGSSVEASFSLPLWVVWTLGALVVAFSFVLVGLFLTRDSLSRMEAPRDDAQPPEPHGRGGLWAGGVLLLLLVPVLVVGSASRLPEVLLWLGIWSVLPMLTYLLGDVWRRIDPFAAVAHRSVFRGRWRYPAWAASWPSVVLLLALIGLEILPGAGHEGRPLALMLFGYALVTLGGMWAVGASAWREHVEVLSRFFRWWGSLAPLRMSRRGVRVRGLDEIGRSLPVHRLSDVAFTVALLYGVNFDGFLGTRAGVRALGALAPLGSVGAHLVVLVVGFAFFLGAYLLAILAVKRFADSLEPTPRVAGRFALSLLPIAAGYHLAHNAFYALEALPVAIDALSDPWGLGWSAPAALAAWAPSLPSPTVVGWLQIALIVLAHVAAVLLAHETAFAGFASRVQAARSEVPLTLVMVFYTFIGLAIVSTGYHAVPGA